METYRGKVMHVHIVFAKTGPDACPYLLAVCATEAAAEACANAAKTRGEYQVWTEPWPIRYIWPPLTVIDGDKGK